MKIQTTTVQVICYAVAAALTPLVLCADSNYMFTKIAAAGETHSAVTFGPYMQPGAITNGGIVGFAPAVATGGESVFLWRQGQLIKLAAANEPLPGGGVFAYQLTPMNVNASGETAFVAERDFALPLPLGLDAGVYRGLASSGLVPIVVPFVTPAPGGGLFYGGLFGADINNDGHATFTGMICSTAHISSAIQWKCPSGSGSLAVGIYLADVMGSISTVVQPGDPAPSGGTFDYAKGPSRNGIGDVTFSGHVFGEDCVDILGAQSSYMFCAESVYLKRGTTGTILPIAHRGDPSPAGANYFGSYGAILNARGDIVFLSELTDATLTHVGVFLYAGGKYEVIAKPGDPMPGGGHFATGGGFSHNAALNNRGDVVFVATLNDGNQGLYVWRNGTLSLVAKTGSPVPGGVIANLDDFGAGRASSMVSINEPGQILFAANVTPDDNPTALIATVLVARPGP
jgi:hypothetical protein